MTSDFMDIQRADNLILPDGKPMIVRPTKYDHVIASEENESVAAMMRDIQKRAEALKGKGRSAGKGDDNMLDVCNDARAGSIDQRLIDPDGEDHPESKANKANLRP